ncbi:MAG: SpoIIE family protein phosphatase [Streptosporangiales bacterium]|nr:SpoIIE family protein phosphatase [Streptosporangiales bacterium]
MRAESTPAQPTALAASAQPAPALAASAQAAPTLAAVPAQAVPAQADLSPESLAAEVLRSGGAVPDLRHRAAAAVRDVTGAEAAYVLVAEETLVAPESWRLAGVATGAAVTGAAVTGGEPATGGEPVAEATVRLPDAPRVCGRPTVHNGLPAPWSTLPPLRDGATRSLLTAPLSADGRLSGVLIASDTRTGRFGPAAADRLGRLARRLAEPLERVRLAERERDQRGWLSFLAEAGDLLAGTNDARLITALAGQLVVARLGTWCATYVHEPAGPSTLADARHRDEQRVPELRKHLAEAGPPERTHRPAAWDALPDGWSHTFPLVAGGRPVGTLVIGREEGPFTAELLKLAEDLSRRVAVALDAARLHQRQAETSRVLRRGLLSGRPCEVPGLDLGVAYEPAGEGLDGGGDFCDVFRAGPGRWLFAIGDVCGTGPEAAAVTGLARHALRLLAREGHGLPRILRRVNEAILDGGPQARFLTLICGEIVPGAHGNRRLSLICAGHPPPLRLTPVGAVAPVASAQLLLGVDPQVEYVAESVRLDPGDSLVCVTDGVTRRRAGGRELDDDDGLARLLADRAELGAESLAEHVRDAAHRFAPTPPHDDLAVLVLQARLSP